MATRINLVGQRFGYLTVTKQVEPQLYQWRKRRAPLRVPQYEVKCDCGTVKITKAKLLRNGSVKSCGCRRYPVRTYLHPAIGRMICVATRRLTKRETAPDEIRRRPPL